MSIDEQRRIRELYEAARDRPEDTRLAWVNAQRQYSPDTVQAVLRLLRAAGESAGFLAGPALRRPEPPRREGRRIGPYRVLGEIDKGGMGVVYKCERDDDVFHRIVALKVVRFDSPQYVEKFHKEREILARLDHDNIARILDGGTTEDGLPYLVMDYIEGQRLDEFCNAKRANLAQRINLMRQTCAAVAYLHDNGVLHRDLKPSNILVTPRGQVKLLDFGIAKQMNDRREASATLVSLGTPEYASPEQLRLEKTTPASDVYSLGAVLYQLLTGRRCLDFDPARRTEATAIVAEQTPLLMSAALASARVADRSFAVPVPLSEWKKLLHGDLDRIVAMALRKEPGRRYHSATALADDLRRYQQRQPVLARGNPPAYIAGRFILRNRTLIAAGLIVAAALSFAAVAGIKLFLLERDIQTYKHAEAIASQSVIDSLQHPGSLTPRQQSDAVLSSLGSLESGYRDRIAPMLGSPLAPRHQISELTQQSVDYLNQLAPAVAQDHQLAVPLADAYLDVSKLQWSREGRSLNDPTAALATAQTAADELKPLLSSPKLQQMAGDPTAKALLNIAAKLQQQIADATAAQQR